MESEGIFVKLLWSMVWSYILGEVKLSTPPHPKFSILLWEKPSNELTLLVLCRRAVLFWRFFCKECTVFDCPL